MSTDCENLLKKFLVINPARRGNLDQIMKDRWMNMGYEEDELKPYIEPPKDIRDERKIHKLQQLGYTLPLIHEALEKERFDEIHAIYLLLKEVKKPLPEFEPLGAGSAHLIDFNQSTAGGPPIRSMSAQVPSSKNRRPSEQVLSTIQQPSAPPPLQTPPSTTSAAPGPQPPTLPSQVQTPTQPVPLSSKTQAQQSSVVPPPPFRPTQQFSSRQAAHGQPGTHYQSISIQIIEKKTIMVL
jgi:MAP/microtubule affinity-regulating kinase